MDLRDFFVGSVAITLGAMMVYTAVVNQGWCLEMKIARVIAESKGQSKARTFVGSIGGLLLLLGIYIVTAPAIATQLFQSSNDQNGAPATFAEAD
ncbi:MAG: hypothetical protein AB8B55_11345 [Mariniblastus sp.]